jgi:hypothetical protein
MVSGRAAGVKREGLPTYPPTWFARYTLSRIPAGKGSMIGLPQIKARIERLQELTQGLAKEVNIWKGGEGPLLPQERKRYLDACGTGWPDWTRPATSWRAWRGGWRGKKAAGRRRDSEGKRLPPAVVRWPRRRPFGAKRGSAGEF